MPPLELVDNQGVGFVGKGSFLAPVHKFSENLTTENPIHCTNFVSVHPICSDDINKIKEVSTIEIFYSSITTQ